MGKTNLEPWRRLQRRAIDAAGRNLAVEVGIFSEAGQHEKSDLSVAAIGAIHEYGTELIPERSWLRRTLVNTRKEISSRMTNVARSVMRGDTPLHDGLDALGAETVRDIRHTIIDTMIPPPLAPATVYRKGHDHPLIETEQLVDAVSHRIVPRRGR